MSARLLFLLLIALVASCTSALYRRERAPVNSAIAPQDYILRLAEPVAEASSGFVLDGGSSGIELVDSKGQKAKIWWDQSGSHQKEFRKAGCTWYGRSFGEIVLGSLKDGRSLLVPSEEASKLLRILEDADRRRLDPEGLSFYIQDIKTKQQKPNQAPEPTVTAVTPRAAHAPRQP